MKIASK